MQVFSFIFLLVVWFFMIGVTIYTEGGKGKPLWLKVTHYSLLVLCPAILIFNYFLWWA
jgi:hypothetical protein